MAGRRNFLYLASASPRRASLLSQLGLRFVVTPVDVEESPRAGEAPGDYVNRLARAKGTAAWQALEQADAPVLAADTAVVVAGRILGKPRDCADAADMLGQLSGRQHEVLTAVAVIDGVRRAQALNRTRVRFRAIRADEIRAYWDSGEPADKAGGYAIQGLGAVFVEEIRGSYSGVVGLPLYETARLLSRFGYRLPA